MSAGPHTVFKSGPNRFEVLDGLGFVVARRVSHVSAHHLANKLDAAPRRAKRKCLSCERMFDSTHIGNRICRWCKTSEMFR